MGCTVIAEVNSVPGGGGSDGDGDGGNDGGGDGVVKGGAALKADSSQAVIQSS